MGVASPTTPITLSAVGALIAVLHHGDPNLLD